MKRTDQERIERELKRREKLAKVAARRDEKGGEKEKADAATYIRDLHALFEYDEHQIYNARDNEDIFELLENMKSDLPEKQWDNVIKTAIKKTKVEEKDIAFTELKSLMMD